MKVDLKATTQGNTVTGGDGECLITRSLSSSSSNAENEVVEEDDEEYPKTITLQLANCRLPYRWAEPLPKIKSCLSGQPLRSNDLESPGGVLRGAIRGDILDEVGDDCQLPFHTFVCSSCVVLSQSFCYVPYYFT